MDKTNLKNCKLQWAFLAEPNDKGNYPSNKYQVDIVFDKDTKKIVDSLKGKKQTVKDLGEGRYSICLKSTLCPTIVTGSKNIKMSKEDVAKIGNGTEAIVQVNQYKGFGGEMYLGLSAIKVTKLVEFSSNIDFEDSDVDYSDMMDDEDIPF